MSIQNKINKIKNYIVNNPTEIVISIIVFILICCILWVMVIQFSPFKICADKNWIGNITFGKQTFDCAVLKAVNVSVSG